ncbi:MAG: histidine phosphatase family protein [Acidimicrobiia bacterium]
MATVHLVRHGEVFNPNHVVYADLNGFNLSPTGVLQAHAAGRHLAGHDIDVVLTSPLARARQTATAIARHHRLEPVVAKNLTETRQYPRWTGQRWDDLDQLFPGQVERYLADASMLDDVDETIAAVAGRVVGVIEGAIAGGADSIVVVGHQDPTQAARLLMTKRSLSELLLDPPRHASVTTLVGSRGSWTERAVWVPPGG